MLGQGVRYFRYSAQGWPQKVTFSWTWMKRRSQTSQDLVQSIRERPGGRSVLGSLACSRFQNKAVRLDLTHTSGDSAPPGEGPDRSDFTPLLISSRMNCPWFPLHILALTSLCCALWSVSYCTCDGTVCSLGTGPPKCLSQLRSPPSTLWCQVGALKRWMP